MDPLEFQSWSATCTATTSADGSQTGEKIPQFNWGWRRNRFRKRHGATWPMWLYWEITSYRNCTSANRAQFESPEREFVKHRVWLIIVSMPSFEGYHRCEALIGLGQTTRSPGGDDFFPGKNRCLADFAAGIRRISAKSGEGGRG